MSGVIPWEEPDRECPFLPKCNLIMFTADLNICTICNKQFDGDKNLVNQEA